MHLRLNTYYGYNEHPEKTMKRLGITYQHATPQSIADQWWFWNCENVPSKLPKHFSILDIDPIEAIGHGLSKEEAECIKEGRKMPDQYENGFSIIFKEEFKDNKEFKHIQSLLERGVNPYQIIELIFRRKFILSVKSLNNK